MHDLTNVYHSSFNEQPQESENIPNEHKTISKNAKHKTISKTQNNQQKQKQSAKTTHENRVEQFKMVPWDTLASIIDMCTDPSPDQRPSLASVMERLRRL